MRDFNKILETLNLNNILYKQLPSMYPDINISAATEKDLNKLIKKFLEIKFSNNKSIFKIRYKKNTKKVNLIFRASVKKENFTAPTKNYLEFRSGIMFKIDKRKSEKKIFNEYKSQIEDEFLKLKINPNIIDWDNCFIDKEILCIVNKENKKFAEYEELEKNKWFVFIKK